MPIAVNDGRQMDVVHRPEVRSLRLLDECPLLVAQSGARFHYELFGFQGFERPWMVDAILIWTKVALAQRK